MRISQEACNAALFRALARHGVQLAHQRILVAELKHIWREEVGLRTADLRATLKLMRAHGILAEAETHAGPALELTDLGAPPQRGMPAPHMPAPPQPPRGFAPWSALLQLFNSEWILFRARRRTHARLQQLATPYEI
jgi:hypothetical protein